LKLVAFIEESFDIQVPDDDIAYENFMSVSALSSYLHKYD
jgi:acyl carrier protein